jgi:hypothetical protein
MTGRSSTANPSPVLGVVKGAARRYPAALRAALDNACASAGLAAKEERHHNEQPSDHPDLRDNRVSIELGGIH